MRESARPREERRVEEQEPERPARAMSQVSGLLSEPALPDPGRRACPGRRFRAESERVLPPQERPVLDERATEREVRETLVRDPRRDRERERERRDRGEQQERDSP